MQDYEIAWTVRYIILGLSLLGSVFVILIAWYGKLTKYLPCKIIFYIQILFLIVNINAVLYTDHFSEKKDPLCPYASEDNKLNPQAPWKQFCMIQAYLIHLSWMAAFFFSFTMVVIEYWIIKNEYHFRSNQQKYLLWASILFPIIVNTAPFFYPEYGFGPSGFFIPTEDGWKQVYFYCGWRSPVTWPKSDQVNINIQQIAYGLNYMLPLVIVLVIEGVLFLKIRKFKSRFKKYGVSIPSEHQYVTKLHKVPQWLFFLLLINMVIRIFPQKLNGNDDESGGILALRIFVLISNFMFDFIPMISAFQFYRFVSTTLDVPQLKFMCKRTQAREKSLLTEKSSIYAAVSTV